MEFPFYVSKVLPLDDDSFAILDSNKPSQYAMTTPYTSAYPTKYPGKVESNRSPLMQIIDKMGEASSRVIL